MKCSSPAFFLEAEIDLAFAFLHLAEYAIQAGNTARGCELLAMSISEYKAVLTDLGTFPSEFEPEEGRLQRLHRGVGKIFEAMVAERRSSQSIATS